MALRVSLLKGGYCTHSRKMVLRGEPAETCLFPSLFALIEHPREGVLLYDTGYSPRFFEQTRHYPARLYAQLTPVFLRPEETAVAQLAERGIAPAAVDYLLISHFHGDHITGLCDFPRARLVCLRQGYERVRALRGIAAVRQGVLPGLLPDDFERRALLIDREDSPLRIAPVPPFAYTYDLFGDETIRLIPLEGHFTGQMGALLRLEEGQEVLLVADACWLREGWQQQRLPHPLAMAIMHDPAQYRQDLQNILRFHQLCPDTAIVPSHCSASIAAFQARQSQAGPSTGFQTRA